MSLAITAVASLSLGVYDGESDLKEFRNVFHISLIEEKTKVDVVLLRNFQTGILYIDVLNSKIEFAPWKNVSLLSRQISAAKNQKNFLCDVFKAFCFNIPNP
jgi:hypothetical protein